jgi:hypothetical protein
MKKPPLWAYVLGMVVLMRLLVLLLYWVLENG